MRQDVAHVPVAPPRVARRRDAALQTRPLHPLQHLATSVRWVPSAVRPKEQNLSELLTICCIHVRTSVLLLCMCACLCVHVCCCCAVKLCLLTMDHGLLWRGIAEIKFFCCCIFCLVYHYEVLKTIFRKYSYNCNNIPKEFSPNGPNGRVWFWVPPAH